MPLARSFRLNDAGRALPDVISSATPQQHISEGDAAALRGLFDGRQFADMSLRVYFHVMSYAKFLLLLSSHAL